VWVERVVNAVVLVFIGQDTTVNELVAFAVGAVEHGTFAVVCRATNSRRPNLENPANPFSSRSSSSAVCMMPTLSACCGVAARHINRRLSRCFGGTHGSRLYTHHGIGLGDEFRTISPSFHVRIWPHSLHLHWAS
jgi:hypothetical protein